ncbi:MAG: glycoside hydrolase family 44 protein [Bacteroidota bacterium]
MQKISLVLVLLLAFGCDSGTDPEMEDPPMQPPPGREVPVAIKANEGRQPISRYIYGSNQDLSDNDLWTVRRIGGNRMTGYNWENDYSNAGSDWMHSSDTYMLSIFGLQAGSEPGRVMTTFHDRSLAIGAESIITLQLAGYVSADQGGTVPATQTAPSGRWKQVQASKGAPFAATPDLSDDMVYMDEFVQFMVDRFGSAATDQGVRWYSMDNEPGLWSETHPRIHPEHLNAADLVDRSIEMALAVKAVDPDAQIVGPALYGFAAFETLQGAPDWAQEQRGQWFIDYYLDRMREAEQQHGIRLLDVLDVHWYPEAQGDSRITLSTALTANDVEARLQAPRTLWDGSYVENSWIGEWKQAYLPLLPTLKASIETYYPGTELAITEYNYGASASVSGGLANADVLGVFGEQDVHLATLWQLEDNNTYVSSAFNLYRNYDGQLSTYGDTRIAVDLADKTEQSVYASIHGDDASQLHIIAINKNPTENATFTFDIAADASFDEADVYYFNATSPLIQAQRDVAVGANNQLTYTVPALTAAHFVVK